MFIYAETFEAFERRLKICSEKEQKSRVIIMARKEEAPLFRWGISRKIKHKQVYLTSFPFIPLKKQTA